VNVPPVITVRLECSSEGVFVRDVGTRLRGVFWVASPLVASTSEKVQLVVELSGTTRKLDATARVIKAYPGKLLLRLVALAEGSIALHLGADGTIEEEVLMPGRWVEKPHAFTEAPTPPHGMRPVRLDAPEPPPPWSGGLKPLDTFGNYQLLERLGRGGMAEVYVARAVIDGGIEKIVALKLTLPDYGPGTAHGNLFLDEARISASLQHKGLVQVFDFGEALGRPYLTMEYVRGRDLETLSRRAKEVQTPLWRPFVLRVMCEVARALEYLHGRTDANGEYLRYVHRDLSPDNVLVSEFGEVKVIDFGVASIRAPEGGTRIVAGKPGYMPPEQQEGRPPNPAWDLYAAGVVLRELLAPESSEIALKATNPDPDKRYASARELAAALERELQTEPAVELGEIVRALCSSALDDERRRVAEVTLKARAARPATRGPLNQLWRAAARTRPGQVLAKRPEARRGLAVVLAGLAALVGGTAVKQLYDARALAKALDRLDERMSAGALSGPGETAIGALAKARALAPNDPRVQQRAVELARMFEVLAKTAEQRGNHSEAVVHLQALAAADPGRPGLLPRLIDEQGRAR